MPVHRILSSLLHPVLFPLFGSVFYLYTTPRYVSNRYKLLVLLVIFVGTYLLPILLLLLLKGLKMIQSLHLTSAHERKFPLLVISFLGILIGRLLFKVVVVNELAIYIIAGSFGLLLVYAFLWSGIKVSIHTLGIGALIGFVIRLSILYQQNFLMAIAVLFLIFGIIANARVKLRAHSFSEVILGVFFGVGTQILVPFIYQNI